MSTVRRIKLRTKTPNPLFEKWLNELYRSTTADNVHERRLYKNALRSLKKYPLTLKSGKECAILRGFGDGLCKVIDDKLAATLSRTEIGPSAESSSYDLPRAACKIIDDIPATELPRIEPSTESLDFPPGTFKILLLVDKQETAGASKKNDPTVVELDKFPMIRYELRHLKVGDFAWIARHDVTGEELLLPRIVERKRIDDLGASIKDGRFHEQKFRLKQSGIENVVYLVEDDPDVKRIGLPASTLRQAAVNTRIQDGFVLRYTSSLADSIKFLATTTKLLQDEYHGKTLRTSAGDDVRVSDGVATLVPFGRFNCASSKIKRLTVTDMFIKQLLQTKGLSVERALTIANEYKTPANLIRAYRTAQNPESLLCSVKNKNAKHNVTPAVSRLIYKYFTFIRHSTNS